ncbi:MAG: hypothetical protein QW136_06900 [Nitrososphaerales archaeon]
MMLGIVGAAVIGLGATSGLASHSLNIFASSMGVGETLIKGPFPSGHRVDVDFTLQKVGVDPDPNSPCNFSTGEDCDGDERFLNKITACSFHATDGDGTSGEKILPDDSIVICKLTDGRAEESGNKPFGFVIAEGCVELEMGYTESEVKQIPITQEAYPGASDVQKVHDVKIIIQTPVLDQGGNPITGTEPSCPTLANT